MEEIEKIAEKLRESDVINKNGYKYIILPFDFRADPHEIRVFSTALLKKIEQSLNIEEIDKIVTIESKGILVSTLLALKMNKPLYIIRKRKYDLEGEKSILKKTGYEESEIYINGIFKDDRIIIVDDLISTGGTLKATLKATNEVIKCKVKGIFIIFDKPEYKGSAYIKEKYPSIPFKTLIKFKIKENNEVEVYF
ncbi:MAG: adenine phosphoribosyltransferase [archaeon]|nr:adenine phosphoribosyltransferase [archaeon]